MRRAWVLLFLVPVISGCIGEGGTSFDPSVSSTGPEGPVPYHTASPSASSNVLPAQVEVLPPTPTPIIHIVMEGETLVGIADHYGLSLEALQAANPSVQPSALTVGAQIMVPTGGSISGEATPTPAALPILQARCWLETSGGTWCFALLKNEYAETLENISAQYTLRDAGGEEISSITAYGLLNILPPASAMPLAVYFPPLPSSGDAAFLTPAGITPLVRVLTAIRQLPGDVRYLPVMLDNVLTVIDSSGRFAKVSGRVMPVGTTTANTLWVLATAYDSAGNVVGIRRWDSPSALAPDSPLAFDFLVSSVGPGIARVELLSEARP